MEQLPSSLNVKLLKDGLRRIPSPFSLSSLLNPLLEESEQGEKSTASAFSNLSRPSSR